MKTKLFPNSYKRIGWILLIVSSIILPLLYPELIDFGNSTVKVFAIWEEGFLEGETYLRFFNTDIRSILFTIFSIFWFSGAFLVTFTREKSENELITRIRIESLVWSIYFGYGVILFFGLFFPYFALIGYFIITIFAIPLFFIIRYYYVLNIAKKPLNVPCLNFFFVPQRFKRVGWAILVPSAIMFVLVLFNFVEFKFLEFKVFAIYDWNLFEPSTVFGFTKVNISHQLFGILYTIGTFLVAFSNLQHENDHVYQIRLESIVWAVFLYNIILIFCFIFFWGWAIFPTLLLNLFALPLLFIVRFYYILNKMKDTLSVEI